MRTSPRRLLVHLTATAVALAILCAVAAVPAQAEVRTASIASGVDPSIQRDLARVGVVFDREAATLAVTVELHRPAPERAADWSGGLHVFVSSNPWPPDSKRCDGSLHDNVGDATVSIWPGLSDDYRGRELRATSSVNFGPVSVRQSLEISADRRTFSVTVADPLLAHAQPRCVRVRSDGRGDPDPMQPYGGPDTERIDGWFDGYLPVDPPPPPPPPIPDETGKIDCTVATKSFKLALEAPGMIVRGRGNGSALVTLSGNAGNLVAAGGTLTRIRGDRPTGEPIPFTLPANTKTAVELQPVAGIDAWRIDVDWTERTQGIAGPIHCRRHARQRVLVRSVRQPRFVVEQTGNTVHARWRLAGGCELTAERQVTLTATGEDGRRTFRLAHPCGRWQASGRAGGLGSSRWGGRSRSAAQLALGASRKPGNYRYQLVARSGGKVLLRRTLLTSFSRWPARRIWSGTDAFVNYCINENRPIRSSGGRLYCVEPGGYSSDARLR